MKRTHKPYQEYFLVAKSSDLAGNNTALFTNNAINLADGQLGILDVSDNTFVTGSNTISQVPAIKILAGTSTSADFSKNYGWHIGEVKPFLETPTIDASHSVQSFTASLTPVQSNSAVYIDGVSLPVASVAATSSVPASVKTYGVNILFRSVRKDRDYGNNIDKLIASYDTPTTLVGSSDADKKSYVLAKLIGRINAQSKLNNLQPQWANIAAKKHVVALGINLNGSATGTAISTIKTGTSVDVMTTTNGTLSVTFTAGMVQTLNNFLKSKVINASTTNILAEIVTVDVDTVNGGFIDGILLVALDHDTAVAYDDIYGVKPTIDVTVGGFTSYTTTNVSPAIEPSSSGRLFKIAFDERAFAQYGNHQLTGFADELIKTPSYIDETKSYIAYILDLYNKDEKYDDSIHHQTRIWILTEATLNTSTAFAESGIVATPSNPTLITSLNSFFGGWLPTLTPGYKVYDNQGGTASSTNPFVLELKPSITSVNTNNSVVGAALTQTVTGLNFSTDMVAGDIAYISTTGTVTPVTLIASKTTTSFTHTVPIATSAPGQYLMRIIFNGYTTYKRVTVTASA
jgi:hypothetical protein